MKTIVIIEGKELLYKQLLAHFIKNGVSRDSIRPYLNTNQSDFSNVDSYLTPEFYNNENIAYADLYRHINDVNRESVFKSMVLQLSITEADKVVINTSLVSMGDCGSAQSFDIEGILFRQYLLDNKLVDDERIVLISRYTNQMLFSEKAVRLDKEFVFIYPNFEWVNEV